MNLSGADLTIDEAREAFELATADGQWRRWWQYIDAILDAALDTHEHETHASA